MRNNHSKLFLITQIAFFAFLFHIYLFIAIIQFKKMQFRLILVTYVFLLNGNAFQRLYEFLI